MQNEEWKSSTINRRGSDTKGDVWQCDDPRCRYSALAFLFHPSTSSLFMTPHEQALQIVGYEARRDADGHLKVYHLPSGDGGGEREVAGINDRYHPEALDLIEKLIADGKYEEAEDAAASHIEKYTNPVAMLSEVPAVQFALRDAAFNRGPTGAVRILQDALGLPVDGIAGPKTKEALQGAEKNPMDLLESLRAAREGYERRARNESSPFWKGLANRWDRQHADSVSMLA
jgi:hypothetical protein